MKKMKRSLLLKVCLNISRVIIYFSIDPREFEIVKWHSGLGVGLKDIIYSATRNWLPILATKQLWKAQLFPWKSSQNTIIIFWRESNKFGEFSGAAVGYGDSDKGERTRTGEICWVFDWFVENKLCLCSWEKWYDW